MRKIHFIAFLSAFACAGQTNIDTTFLSFKWASGDILVEQMRDGTPIVFARNKDEWIAANREDKPAFCYYNFDPRNGVLYNGHAATYSGFAPYGWRMPDKFDFERLYQEERSLYSHQGGWISPINIESKFNAVANGYYEGEGCIVIEETKCGTGGVCDFYDKGDRSIFWTKDFGEKDFHVTVFNISDWGKNLYISDEVSYLDVSERIGFYEENLSSGASVRFIRNDNEFTPEFPKSYAQLLPSDYYQLKEDLFDIIADRVPYYLKDQVLQLDLRMDKNGRNISRKGRDIEDQTFDDVAFDYLTKWNRAPMYHGSYLECGEMMKLNIRVTPKVYNNSDLETGLKTNNSELLASVNNPNLKFTKDNRAIQIRNMDTEELEKSFNRIYLMESQGRGPMNGLGFLIPGLGPRFAQRGNGWVGFMVPSILTGVTCLTSKILSNHFHKQYREGLYHDQELYNKSNTFQRIFLISGGIYSAMMLVDLTATFTIGSKNKKDQRTINKFIKQEYPNGFRIDN